MTPKKMPPLPKKKPPSPKKPVPAPMLPVPAPVLPVPAPMSPPAPVPGDLDQLKTYVEGMKAGRCGPQMDEDVEFHVSLQDWDKLCEQYDIEERVHFYRYTYDASKSILTLHGSPSAPHEIFVEFFRDFITESVGRRKDTIRVATGTMLKARTGQYSGSRKQPDLAILEKNRKGWMKVTVSFEIGFSQTYEQLKEAVKLILKGTGSVTDRCILVKITENPRYRCPLSTEARDEKVWRDPDTIERDEFEGDTYGPIYFEGQKWMGSISEIFWEMWKLDAATNEIQLDGERQIIHPMSPSIPRPEIPFGLALSHLQPDDSVKLDWDYFERIFQTAVVDFAKCRYEEWYEKTSGDDRKDKDYVDEGDEGNKSDESDEEQKERQSKKKKRRMK
ncbi:hypothetical protein CLAIMM_15210 [Cladophialophora immunda]|nr:hypothetical protein CLAIMM_15210 [Cladophialophora immunda]